MSATSLKEIDVTDGDHQNFGDARQVFTFAFRVRSKEYRVDIESGDPERDGAVIGILGREE